MNLSRASILIASTGLFALLAGCGSTPASRTTTASQSTTTTAAGGETRTNVSETREQGPNGQATIRRTETSVETTPGSHGTPPPPH